MKVLITCKETVHYKKLVDLTAEEYAEIQAAIERDKADVYFDDIAEHYIDRLYDVEEGSGFREVEFYEERPKTRARC